MRRTFLRFLVAAVLILSIGLIGFTLWLRDRYVVPILTYHHIGTTTSKKDVLNTVSPESFEWQMRFLKRHGYRVISFEDLVEGIKKGYSFTRNTVVVQFDDGYEDNYTYAFPILQKNHIPAMVFLVSDVVCTPGFVNWKQVKEMEQFDFLAGAHTRRHQYLPELNLEQAREEIFGSKKVIEQNLGHKIDYFAYPSGGFSARDKELVREAGFKAAVTTNRGKAKFNHDLFEIKRIRMNERDDRYQGLVMWAKLSGYYNLLRKPKSGSVEHETTNN